MENNLDVHNIYGNLTSICRTFQDESNAKINKAQLKPPSEPDFVNIKQEIVDEETNEGDKDTLSTPSEHFLHTKEEIADEEIADDEIAGEEKAGEEKAGEEIANEEIAAEDIYDEETNKDGKLLMCRHCGLVCEKLCAFIRHSRSVRKCESCPKIFCGPYSNRERKAHHKKEHNYKPKAPHICTNCHKPFPYKSTLKNHLIWSKCGRLV